MVLSLPDGPDAGAAVVIVAFAVAARLDLRVREVPDRLWIVVALVGTVLGAIAVVPDGALGVGLWLLAAGFVLEHLLPWDARFADSGRADLVEAGVYAVVLAVVGLLVVRLGVGGSGVPVPVVAVVLTTVFARGLFAAGILFGGADAKAVMVAGLAVPFFARPLLWVPTGALPITSLLPFAVNLLLDAALISVVAPVALAIRNAARDEFRWRDGFTTFTIPVAELPRRWVWVRDPEVPIDRAREEAIETSEEDRAWRRQLAADLAATGRTRVRVGPQLPFVVFLLAGSIAAVLFGNVVLDLLLAR
ncbi:hypothetical protein B1B_14296 [mine drainage metagenome]|uniref:Type IV leader peptidase family protein n=1 Tax=mine drainage metagenome TaxID=410659 RepID=T1AIW6_9ZZZZ